MLVLTRKLREQITIGEDVTITVVRIKGSTVQIGIEAPRSIRVVRGELARLDARQLASGERPAEDGHSPHQPAVPAGETRRHGRLAPLVRRVSRRCRVPNAPVLADPLSAPTCGDSLIAARH